MRIALFTETFLPKIDGVVNTLCHLLEHLEERGHQSLLFAPTGSPTQYAATPVVSLSGYPLPFYPEIKLTVPWAKIKERLRTFAPDLIHLLNPFTLGLAGLRQSRSLGASVIASYHTDLPGYMARYGFPFLCRPLWTYLRWLHNQAAVTLCPSRITQKELESHGFHNLQVWSRGVDVDQFHPCFYNDSMRGWLTGRRPQAPLLLYVGRLAAEKRIDLLEPLLAVLPEVRLAIVGDGPARRRLERRFAGKPVVFTGYLRGEALARAFASADLFVFPSANETFGNVVLEAMASGLPVVAAAAGGPLELVADGHNGLLFPPDNPAAFIAAVERLVREPQLAHRLGAQACSCARMRSWSSVLDRLLQEYARLAGGKRM